MEQAKLSFYSFWKTNKNNWRSRKKQIEALKDLKPEEQKAIENKSDDKLSMQKETYDRLSGKKLNEIQEISNKIDFNNLTCYLKTSGISSVNFIKFKGLFLFFF